MIEIRPLLPRPLLPGGIPIIESDLLVDGPFEDWSKVRSHGRAARRRAKHRQNIRLYYKPSRTALRTEFGIVMHPEMARQLRYA